MGVAIVVSHRNALIGVWLLCGWLAAAPCCGDETAEAPPADPPPFEFAPYRVECVIAADADDPASQRLARRLARELPDWIARTAGERWRFAAHEEPAADWAMRGRLSNVQAADFPAFDAESADVLFRVVVSREGSRVMATVRGWEPLFGYLGPMRTAICLDPRELSGSVAELLWDLFRPRAAWERQDDRTVGLRVQGGALADGGAGRPLVTEHELFAPWIIFRNREREVQKVQELPWTLFSLLQLEDGRGTGDVHSGLRNPLGARPRGRIELLAVAMRPQWPETAVHMVALSKPPRPLPAHDIELTPVMTGEETGQTVPRPVLKRLTDRDGVVRLARGDEPRLQWLKVTSGDLLLARVPILPGMVPAARLELPDDQLRLYSEGQLKLLQGDVISVVAQRSALMASARAAAKQRLWDESQRRVRQIENLPSAQSFRERVSAIRVAAASQARARGDRLTEQRVNRLCDDTEELIQHYLGDEKLKLLKEELAELEAALKID